MRHARFPSLAYSPAQVAKAYGLPQLTGKGFKAGVISLGGAFSQSDFNAARAAWGLPSKTVAVISVNGNSPQPDPGGADVENMMDCEIISGIAPNADINFYACANTDQDFVAGVLKALQDGCDAISISWGAPERQWSPQARAAMDQALQACVQAGVSVSVASGDNGSGDGLSGANVDYPASSPWALACGGTSLVAVNGIIQNETVWNNGNGGGATGGGFSIFEAKPNYQAGIFAGSGRGSPDVAGPADPETGWIVYTGGNAGVVGGTSAVAPMWAGIYLLLCERLGKRPGFLNQLLYPHPEAFFDVTQGNNGAYTASKGWDPATGWGSPNGPVLFNLVAAGSPPPPPVTPPGNPPPVAPPGNPPPVPGPIEGVLETQVLKIIDDLFAKAEAQVHGPLALLKIRALKMINKAIDLEIHKLFANGQPNLLVRQVVLLVLGRAFTALEGHIPQSLVGMVEELRPELEGAVLQLLGI